MDEQRDFAEEAEATRAQREDETLGSCGCTDYHMADCHLGGAWLSMAEYEPNDSEPDDPRAYE
jgi:hypothetical protein